MTLKKALIWGLILELFLGCAAAAFYFKFYIYTPTYSVRAMQQAIDSGNVEELERLVDLDAVFSSTNGKLVEIVPDNDAMHKKLQDGSFAALCKDEFVSYVKNGKWSEQTEITEESSFQDKLGLKTMRFRNLEYIYTDLPPGVELPKDQTLTDKLLAVGLSLVEKYVFNEGGSGAEAEVAAEENADLPAAVTVGIRVYEPNYGDTYILNLKLRQQEDKSWRMYDIENYGEYASSLLKQNERDFVRYKEKVRVILTATQEKLNELNTQNANKDMDWIFAARSIFDESNKQLDALEVPVAGGYLSYLLDERKEADYELLESYYDLAEQQEKMADARKKAQQNTGDKKKRPVFNANIWDNRLKTGQEQIAAAQQKVAANQAKLEAIVGKAINRAEVAQVTAKNLRNNDDAAVRAANYPGADGGGDTYSLVGGENLPVISAYGDKVN